MSSEMTLPHIPAQSAPPVEADLSVLSPQDLQSRFSSLHARMRAHNMGQVVLSESDYADTLSQILAIMHALNQSTAGPRKAKGKGTASTAATTADSATDSATASATAIPSPRARKVPSGPIDGDSIL